MLIAVVAVVACGLLVGGVMLARMIRALLEQRLGLLGQSIGGLDQRLGELDGRVDQRLGELHTRVDQRLEGIDGRLLSTQQSAGETTAQIVERLGKLDGTAAQMLQRANDLARLEQALRPPKARGGFGEIMLEKLLADSLPADAYRRQYTFANGERVDAVIKADKLLPIDSKFSLDNFVRLVEAENDEERVLYEKAFARDVKAHVDSIASKYIRPGENTFDFAFMYVPSESVYYELVCGKAGVYQHALAKRVFPVSPSTFHAFLLMILLGLRGMQIEQHAQEVMAYVGQVSKDFERFRGDFDTVGKHLQHAQSKYSEADRRLERLETRLERAAEWDEPPAIEMQEPLPRIEAA
jgi:DNA recombination protein RmuC